MDNNTIIRLEGPDRVRRRPSVIFTSDDVSGATYAVKMLLNIFITEAALGFSKELSVTVYNDNVICITSFDRGLVIDETIVNGKPAWQYDFCELYAAPRQELQDYYFSVEDIKNHNKLYGAASLPLPKYCADQGGSSFELCCVQYACDFMQVESVCNGVRKQLNFKKGYSVSEPLVKEAKCNSYTQICFKLDCDVFSDIVIPFDNLASILKYAAISIPGFQCSLCDERARKKETYLFPQGINDYAKAITSGYKTSPFFVKEIEATGKERYNKKEYDARIKVVFAFSEYGKFFKCIHNYECLEHNGKHLNVGLEKIGRVLEFMGIISQELPPDAQNDLAKHLVVVLESNCSPNATCWENATKKAITNKMIADMCTDLFDDDFSYFIEQNKDIILSIINKKTAE